MEESMPEQVLSVSLVEQVIAQLLRDMPLVGPVDELLADKVVRQDCALREALARNAEAGLVPFDVAANQGKLLYLLARAANAQNVLEIGTLGGYSTIWLARALPAGGTVVTLERDEKCVAVANQNLASAGVREKVKIVFGNAIDLLPELYERYGRHFDFAFVDADKQNDVEYIKWTLKLCRPNSLVVIDNVIRFGTIMDPATSGQLDPGAQGSRDVLEFIGKHADLEATALQTVGMKGWDGFAIARIVS
jgi:predicted O-methyltransferase YrrM